MTDRFERRTVERRESHLTTPVKKHGLVTAFGSPERGAARSLFGQGNVSYYEAGYYQEPSYRQSWDHYYEGSLEYPAAQESHHRTSPYRNQPNALNYYENDYMVDNRRRSNSKPRQNNNSHQPSVYPNLMTTPAYQADYTPKPRQKRVYKRPSASEIDVDNQLSLAESLKRDLRSLAIESQTEDLVDLEDNLLDDDNASITTSASKDLTTRSIAESFVTQVSISSRSASRNPFPVDSAEAEERRLQQRQKQIDYGKNTIGYKIYTTEVPPEQRRRSDPGTPDKYARISKRSWDGLVRSWRRRLHEWDPPAEKSDLAHLQPFMEALSLMSKKEPDSSNCCAPSGPNSYASAVSK